MIRLLSVLACLFIPLAAGADAFADDVADQIAAHFEAASSRLRPDEAELLDQFVARVRNTPGAKLAVLVPITSEPARARFVAARVTELERRVQAVAEMAEYRHVLANSNADVLWLALLLSPQKAAVGSQAEVDTVPGPISARPDHAPLALTAPAAPSAPPPPTVATSDLRLDGWTVRGVRHRADGAVMAYIARTAAGSVPREVFEHQTDRDLGLVKEIALSPDVGWVVRTEIGWIGQGGPSSGS